MNILIVDGNEREASERYTKMGMNTQYEVYENVLQNLSKNNLNISVVHPAIKDQYLPFGVIYWEAQFYKCHRFQKHFSQRES